MAEINLEYDESYPYHVRRIGESVVEYGWLGLRARRVGSHELSYDSKGTRLRAIGEAEISYDDVSSPPRVLGNASLVYDGRRLRRIGPHELTYDRFTGRIRTIGPMTLEYEGSAARSDRDPAPARVIVPGEHPSLDNDELAIVYFVLCLIQSARTQTVDTG